MKYVFSLYSYLQPISNYFLSPSDLEESSLPTWWCTATSTVTPSAATCDLHPFCRDGDGGAPSILRPQPTPTSFSSPAPTLPSICRVKRPATTVWWWRTAAMERDWGERKRMEAGRRQRRRERRRSWSPTDELMLGSTLEVMGLVG
ncbi:hypothetical protein HanRHA438_Chr04g0161391 [Helianthus annuus]|nr:hypothetical protein HanRHA438_Chr04g0161391 [Helianthus annuus]